jgi:hypothetical protein
VATNKNCCCCQSKKSCGGSTCGEDRLKNGEFTATKNQTMRHLSRVPICRHFVQKAVLLTLSCRVASISSIPTLPRTHSRYHVDLVPSPTYAPPSNSFMLRRVTVAASLSAAGATRFMPTGPFQPAGGATTGQKKKSGKGERFKDPQIRARERTPDGRSPRSGGPHNIIQKGRSRSIRSSKK